MQILIDWANQQDHWVRAIASEVIAARRQLAEQSIEAAYCLLLAEKGLSADPTPNVPALTAGTTSAETAEDLCLTRLANLAGVNALASGQEIAFNPKLTVLFGENAAGKTGYVRVLKRVSSVRAAQPILSNVHSIAATNKHATIDYTLSGVLKSLDWNDEVGVPPLTRMSVFDSDAVSLHVDDDLTYVFTPGELALFQHVHQAIDAVKVRLESEKKDAQPGTSNPFLHRFARDQVVYPRIETLGAATSVPELEALANVSAEEEAALATLKDRVDALQPRASDTRAQVASADRDLYGSLRDAADVVRSFPWEKYNTAVGEVVKAGEQYVAASRTAFAVEDIPGIFGEAWQSFITAGETYLREAHGNSETKQSDPCPYCRRDLDDKALALVRKYRDYCNNAPKRDLDAASSVLRQLSATVTGLQVNSLMASCARRRAAFTDESVVPSLLPKAIAFLERVETSKAHVAAGAVLEWAALAESAIEMLGEANAAVADAERAIGDLRKQADERKKDLETEIAKLRRLENRLTLRGILPDVRVYVERAQWAGRAAPILARISSVMKSVTEQSKLASQELLNRDFERLFEAETRALRAPRVRLDFPGRKGQAARKKVLVPNHRLSETLSEGEQKVIALADFLAEAALHRTTAPVVFDDPVNSLDHRRIREIAARIVSLSNERQVILFTHNILLVMELVSLLEDSPSDFSYFSIEEIDGNVGVVTAGGQPRLDSLGDLKGKINRLIQDAGAQAGEMRSALIEKAYEILRAWIEVFVEKELLAGVAQRYTPHVSVTALKKIKSDRLPAADAVLRPLYEKICRYIASHSQPAPTLGVRPTLDELKQDWQGAQDAGKTYTAK